MESVLRQGLSQPIARALKESSFAIAVIFFFSFFINLIYLASPLYMMQIYDRVLHSKSIETLVFLTVLIAGCYMTYAILDALRSKILASISDIIEENLADQLMNRVLSRTQSNPDSNSAALISRDLDTIRQFSAGPGLLSLMDLPWTPFFVGILFLIHPKTGSFALVACALQAILTLLSERLSRDPMKKASRIFEQSNFLNDSIIRFTDTAKTMGLKHFLSKKWQKQRLLMIKAQMVASDRVIYVSALNRFFSMFFSSSILGLGAWLYLNDAISAGGIFAGSLLLGKALQPLQQFSGSWKAFTAARESFRRLNSILLMNTADQKNITLPEPKGTIKFDNVYWQPERHPTPILKNINFELLAGKSLAIVGPSASGKSTIAKLIAGSLHPSSGQVRIDGADMSNWDYQQLSNNIGYLPQDVALFPGTVAENISRYTDGESEAVIEAAQLANAHEMIIGLTRGYATELFDNGLILSGGQRQRLALARAVFGKPRIVVLDEPNANLDTEGEAALASCLAKLKQEGCTVVIVTHRLSVLQTMDFVMSVTNGTIAAVAPAQEFIERQISSIPRPAPVQKVSA